MVSQRKKDIASKSLPVHCQVRRFVAQYAYCTFSRVRHFNQKTVKISISCNELCTTTKCIKACNRIEALHGSVKTAYQAVYDVTEHEIDSWQEIRFSEVPD